MDQDVPREVLELRRRIGQLMHELGMAQIRVRELEGLLSDAEERRDVAERQSRDWIARLAVAEAKGLSDGPAQSAA
jgi:hypothetical protein